MVNQDGLELLAPVKDILPPENDLEVVPTEDKRFPDKNGVATLLANIEVYFDSIRFDLISTIESTRRYQKLRSGVWGFFFSFAGDDRGCEKSGRRGNVSSIDFIRISFRYGPTVFRESYLFF
ncbi:hypothetical protein NE237_000590 [Protea cynaroides]|uniref:Uncharacterized protein n=1 Tax=Protea cynaroides TaxID=273540 RepID=A0A9Q0KRV4_9MAGN|nr:hypothetical protein NE237_000590 [Protea cynaroides]